MTIKKQRFDKGIILRPDSDALEGINGEIKVDSADSKIKVTLNSTSKEIVTNDQTQTLTGKTIDADSNTITNIENADIKAGAAIDATKIANGSVSNAEFQYLDGVTSAIQTQINAKVTGPASATDEAIARYDGTTGKLIKSGTGTISTAGAISGLTGLTSSGTVNATGTLQGGNVQISTNTIVTTSGDLTINPNSTSNIVLNKDVNIVENIFYDSQNNAATGANVTLTAPTKAFVRLTDAGLTSIDMITAAESGSKVTYTNATGNPVVLNNLTGATASNQILTGTGQPFTLANNATLDVIYDNTSAKWKIIGSSTPIAADISNTPSGNLSATTVQDALNELQGDIDTQVVGPASATNEAIARFDGTTGKLIKSGTGTITTAGAIAGLTGLTSSGTVNATGTLQGGNVQISTNTITTTSGNLTINPNSTSDIILSKDTSIVENIYYTSLDVTTSGSNVNLAAPTTAFVRLTNAALVSVDMITVAESGSKVTYSNATGTPVTLNNLTGATASRQILTGTGLPYVLADGASVDLIYDSTTQKWRIIGSENAASISNTPAGNLAATDVQSALNELQGDIDTQVVGPASSTNNAIPTFSGTTGKLIQNTSATMTTGGAATFTGVTSSGTVTLSGALNLSSNTTNSQTGSNVSISSATSNVIRLTSNSLVSVGGYAVSTAGRITTFINTSTTPITIINEDTSVTAANRIVTGTGGPITLLPGASIQMIYNSTTARHQVIGGTGASAGSLSTIFQLTGSDVSTWSTGDNATFLGGGTLSGTFVAETAAPLGGFSSYKYTQAPNSVDDYLASPAQTVDSKFRGRECTLTFPFKYNGTSNSIEVIFYDATNAAIIPSSVFIQNSPTVSQFKTNIVIPPTCASIRVGFQVRTLSSGSIFEFDDVEMTSDTTIYADIANEVQAFSATKGSTGTAASNVDVANFSSINTNDNNGLFSFNNSTGIFTALKQINVTATISGRNSVASVRNWIYVDVDGSAFQSAEQELIASNSSDASASTAFTRNPGETWKFRTFGVVGGGVRVNVVATASNQNILTAPETFSSDTASFVYANAATYTLSTLADAPVGTYITFTYAANTNTRTQTTGSGAGNLRPTQTNANMNVNGIRLYPRIYSAASTGELPAAIAIQIGKGLKGLNLSVYKNTGKSIAGNLDFNVIASSSAVGLTDRSYNETTGILVLDAGRMPLSTSTITTLRVFDFSDNTNQNNGYVVINASKNPALTGMNIGNKIAYVKDVKSSGTAGGTFTSGAWQTRTLNTLEGDQSFISLSSNRFTLQPGRYDITATAPANSVESHKAKIRDITNSVDVIIGSSERRSAAANSTAGSFANGTISINTATEYELQHRCQTTANTTGFGNASSFSVNEVYSQVIIKKLD